MSRRAPACRRSGRPPTPRAPRSPRPCQVGTAQPGRLSSCRLSASTATTTETAAVATPSQRWTKASSASLPANSMVLAWAQPITVATTALSGGDHGDQVKVASGRLRRSVRKISMSEDDGEQGDGEMHGHDMQAPEEHPRPEAAQTRRRHLRRLTAGTAAGRGEAGGRAMRRLRGDNMRNPDSASACRWCTLRMGR
jgi:hypothetical protein